MTAEHTLDMPPRDEAGYLLLNADWRILALDDGSTFASDGAVSLVGQPAAAVIGPAALTSLQAHGAALFTLDNVDYVLSATTFELPTGTIRVVRARRLPPPHTPRASPARSTASDACSSRWRKSPGCVPGRLSC